MKKMDRRNAENPDAKFRRRTPWLTLLTYSCLGFLWIFFSDHLAELLSPNNQIYTEIQTYKGIFYIIITTIMIYFLIKLDFSKILHLNEEIRQKNEDLEAYSKKLMATDQDLKEKIMSLNQTMHALNVKNQLIEDIYKSSNTGIAVWDTHGNLREVNDGFLNLFGYARQSIEGKQWIDVVNLSESDQDYLDQIMASKQVHNTNGKIVRPDGTTRDVLWSAALSRYSDTDEALFVSFWIDITSEKNNERLLFEIAYTDKLTGLQNKAVLEEIITTYLGDKIPFVVFFLDLDDFKNLNEYYGYRFGDRIIEAYASDLKSIFGEKHIYRWGGDEFLVLIPEMELDKIHASIDRIMELSAKRRTIDAIDFYLSVSMGIVFCPENGTDYETVISNMDMALYHAKRSGKNTAVFFETDFQSAIEERIEIDNRINEAIHNNAFELYYQPVYNLITDRIDGVEVLLRWKNNPFKIGTEKLIKVAEETGKILIIDQMVIRSAFNFIQSYLMDTDYLVAINLSAKSVGSLSLIDYINECARETGVRPQQVIFEITEHSLINKIEETTNMMRALKALGYRFSLDDFGIGHSSLNYLVHLDFDYLKIDKSYIDGVAHNENSKLLVEQIIHLAQNLGLVIVAEGIEEQDQHDFLKTTGCEYGQGYLMARPMNQERVLELLQ